jgi:hypothetical protein
MDETKLLPQRMGYVICVCEARLKALRTGYKRAKSLTLTAQIEAGREQERKEELLHIESLRAHAKW